MFVQAQSKIKMSTFFGCILKWLQPLTAHSRQLLCVQPNDSGKRNTAKSCTEYSQCICSVLLQDLSGSITLLLTILKEILFFSSGHGAIMAYVKNL